MNKIAPYGFFLYFGDGRWLDDLNSQTAAAGSRLSDPNERRMRMIRNIIIFVCITAPISSVVAEGWWRLYFTSPGKATPAAGVKNPEKGLEWIIGRSKKSFYGAFYEVSDPRIVHALIAARTRGVTVCLVTESDRARKRRRVGERLSAAGVGIVTDDRRGLMHNKFAVIDGEYIWTGSYNPTVNGAEKNNNNAILIRSPLLAEIYQRKFMTMFREHMFGGRRKAGPFAELANAYYVKIEGTDINAYFSPEDNVERIILKRLSKAKNSIHFMAYSFTSDRIGEMMIAMFRRGVQVNGIFERRGSRDAHSEYYKMKLEGLHVKLDRNRNLMHHKVIVIDGYRVITGSYNFSRNARVSNDENVLIVDNGEIAAAYLAEFNRLFR
jgi:phosphatidylserine/phosphatidylglycerophosphate/cardiolipin synthase-like enzyme